MDVHYEKDTQGIERNKYSGFMILESIRYSTTSYYLEMRTMRIVRTVRMIEKNARVNDEVGEVCWG